MKKFLIPILLISSSANMFAQKEIKAKIEIDKNNNLLITQVFSKNKSIYVFPHIVKLDNGYSTFKGKKNSYFDTYEIQNTNQLSFTIDTDKKEINDDFFIYPVRYLGIEEKDFFSEKKFNLDINSEKYKIVFPTEETFKRKFISEPMIVGGNFKSLDKNGFKVYYIENDFDLNLLEKGLEGIQKSYDFYLNIFGKKDKPAVVFAPIQGASRTKEGIIVYNTNTLKKGKRTTISHEFAHLWFGEDGIIFKESAITEGITEFLSLHYLTATYGEESVEDLIKEKYFYTEGLKDFRDINNKELEKYENNVVSYSLLPLHLYARQKNDQNFLKTLSDFYAYKKDSRRTSGEELNYYLQSKGLETVFTDKFPDFFISSCNATQACVYSSSAKPYDVEFEFISNKDEKQRKTLKLSKNSPQIIEINDLKSITIDPEFKIQQVSRLNDIWNYNGDDIFNKNRYFKSSNLKSEIAKISKNISDFFISSDDKEISNLFSDNEKQKEILKAIKKKFVSSPETSLTGAAASFVKNKNNLFLYFPFYDKVKNETDVLKLRLKVNNDYSKLEEVEEVD